MNKGDRSAGNPGACARFSPILSLFLSQGSVPLRKSRFPVGARHARLGVALAKPDRAPTVHLFYYEMVLCAEKTRKFKTPHPHNN